MTIPPEIADTLRKAFGPSGAELPGDRRVMGTSPTTITLRPPLKVSQRRIGLTCSGTIGTIRVFVDRIEADVQTLIGRRTEVIQL